MPLQLLFSPLGVLCYPRGAGSPLCCLPWARLHARRRAWIEGLAACGGKLRWEWAESPICAAFWRGFWVLSGHSIVPGALRGTRGQQGPAAAPLRGRTGGAGASARGWGHPQILVRGSIPRSWSRGASPNPGHGEHPSPTRAPGAFPASRGPWGRSAPAQLHQPPFPWAGSGQRVPAVQLGLAVVQGQAPHRVAASHRGGARGRGGGRNQARCMQVLAGGCPRVACPRCCTPLLLTPVSVRMVHAALLQCRRRRR